MRILVYDPNKKIDLTRLSDQDLFYYDIYEDHRDVSYCLEVRHYDYVIIEGTRFIEKYMRKISKLVEESHLRPKMIVVTNNDNFAEKYKNLFEITDTFSEALDQVWKGLKKIPNSIELDKKTFTVSIKGEFDKLNLSMKDEFSYKALLYLIRHTDKKLNIDAILNGITEDPEFERSARVEDVIAKVRDVCKSELRFNPIKNYKKIGYTLDLNKIIEQLSSKQKAAM